MCKICRAIDPAMDHYCKEGHMKVVPIRTGYIQPANRAAETLFNAVAEVLEELKSATAEYGPFSSPHEGHSVIEEEFDELWDEIKMKHQDKVKMRKEAKQTAAMAIRFMIDCT